MKVLNEYLKNLRAFNANLVLPEITDDLDEITQFSMSLDQSSIKKILQDKIQAFETRLVLMRQELVTVHQAIINHFITINALQTSKMAILPLITTEMAIAKGKTTEGEALQLTGELVNLLQNIVNKNIEATQENLSRLRLSSIPDETYAALSRDVGTYLEKVNQGNAILEGTKPGEISLTLPASSSEPEINPYGKKTQK